MNKISLKTRIIRFFQWIPFTWNTVFFTVIFWFLFSKFHQPITKENINDQQLPFIRLMSMFIMVMFIALAALSVLSALATWIYFLVLRNDKKSALEVHFTLEQKGQKQQQFLQASLPKVFRPILGFIKARLEYDNAQLTDKFALLSSHRKKNSLLRNAIAGKSRIELPDIKEYQIKGGILFFEDLFQIISLPVTQQVAGNFYQSPKRMPETIEEVSPKETDSMDIRIEQLRKVEGDLLHYKDFESGDDVRRIVWKVFAKNRELVVRIPEQMEPYASKLNFYASFYNHFSSDLIGSDYFAEMLNYYKTNVWSVYKTLQQKDWAIKYIPDQTFHLSENLSEEESTERIISNSVWQRDVSTSSYFLAKKGTMLVISSLCKASDIQKILNEQDNSVQIVYIKLSELFKQYVALHWLKSIFIVAAPDRLSKLRSRWFFSPLRRQILKNEKEIEAMLD